MLSSSFYMLAAVYFATNVLVVAYNYCYGNNERQLCRTHNQTRHIMCRQNLLQQKAELVAVIPMTRKLKKIIIDEHNKCRDALAAGNDTSEAGMFFPKAARLRVMIWDEELAFIAQRHVAYCTLEHDRCHNTTKFENSGQNVGRIAERKPQRLPAVISRIVRNMCDERNFILNSNDFPEHLLMNGYKIQNFIVMASDRVSRVGCGFAYCKNCGKTYKHCYYLTCNYDFGIPPDQKVYATDLKESASECGYWYAAKSKKYKNLCENNPAVHKY